MNEPLARTAVAQRSGIGPMTMFVVLLIAVVVIALVARAATKPRAGASDDRAWLAGRDEAARPITEPHAPYASDPVPAEASERFGEAAESLPSEDTDATGEDGPAPTTADGWRFTVREDGVEAVRTAFYIPGQFVAARVSRITDSDYWGLEVLEKEAIEAEGGTFWPLGGWVFRSEGEARAAMSLLERRVIRPPIDEHGVPRTFTEEDFARSRRFMEQPLPESEPFGEDVARE